MRKSLAIGLPAALFICLVSCGPIKRGEYASGGTMLYCDEGFKNILEEEIEVFEYTYPQSSIIPFWVDEQTAIDSLMADATDGIIITRELNQNQIQTIKSKYNKIVRQKPIAVDAVALIVNKDNPIDALSYDQIKDIMNGDIKKWNQLAVNDTADIKIVFDNAGSSTVSYLRNTFLPEGKTFSEMPNFYAEQNNPEVFDIVKQDKNSIGVISVSWLGTDLSKAKKVPMDQRMEEYQNQNDTIMNVLTTEVKILKVSNPCEDNDFSPIPYAPYQAYIYQKGCYPLVRTVYMAITASKSGTMKSFFDFIDSFVGQKIISLTGVLPYNMHQRVVEIQ